MQQNILKETIIIGIDPGSIYTGYGIIHEKGTQQTCIAHGRIHPTQKNTAERLHTIYESLDEIIQTYQPQEMSIEQVFFHINPQSALKLGQARGAAMIAAAQHALPVSEYSAKQVKKAVVGYGAANKAQVQHMITAILKLKKTPETDAADALAIALCHCQSRRLARKLSVKA